MLPHHSDSSDDEVENNFSDIDVAEFEEDDDIDNEEDDPPEVAQNNGLMSDVARIVGGARDVDDVAAGPHLGAPAALWTAHLTNKEKVLSISLCKTYYFPFYHKSIANCIKTIH